MSYLIYVDGKILPTKEHGGLVDAMEEAGRLAQQPDNKMRKIFILQVVKVNEPVVTRQWKPNEVMPGCFYEVSPRPWA